MNRRAAGAFGVWVTLTVAAVATVGAANFARLRNDFEAEARTLHRVISQRADQHDAHLTSLAAVLASPEHSLATFRAVTEAVLRFYPRIAAVDVVNLTPAPDLVFTTRDLRSSRLGTDKLGSAAANLSAGQTIVIADPGGGTYHLVKRLPETTTQADILVMTIDAMRLMDPEADLPTGMRLSLRDPSGREIVQRDIPPPLGATMPVLAFEKELGSRSQPLLLQISRSPTINELLSPMAIALAAALTGIGVLLASFVLRERRAAHEARERASLHEHQARLAHAMRVNTVGEMASGIAHELTQPLTAILSNSQAGLRLAHSPSPDPGEIVGVLDANVRMAKRAGDILSRLRAYVSNSGPVPEKTSLNQLVRNVAELVWSDLGRRGVALNLDLDPGDPFSMIDRVSIEQVVHNLVRNAADASESLPQERRAVTVATLFEGGTAEIKVSDNGFGISPADLPRLFEPFFTTKPDGMGLGLSLCERLVEAFGGQIAAANALDGGAVFTIRLPLITKDRREAAE